MERVQQSVEPEQETAASSRGERVAILLIISGLIMVVVPIILRILGAA